MGAIEVSYTVSGEGPPLYMVHGIGSRRETWDGLLPELEDHFTCVRYDLRGHGASPIPPVPYTLDDLVDDLEALRQRLGHDRIHVIGHSLGGQIGPAYALAHPGHTASVVLLSTAAGRTEDDSAKVEGVVAKMRAEGVEPPTHLLELPVRTDHLGPDHRGIGLHGSLHQATYRGVPEDNRSRNEEEEARIRRRRVGRRPRPETDRHRRATAAHPGRLNDQ